MSGAYLLPGHDKWTIYMRSRRDTRSIEYRHLTSRQRSDIRRRLRAVEADTPRNPNAFSRELYLLSDHYGVSTHLLVRIYLGATRTKAL